MPLLYEDAERVVNEDGSVGYRSTDGGILVLNDGAAPPAAFKRNAIRWVFGQLAEGQKPPEPHSRCLVGVLNGVYVYVQGNQVIVSARNMGL